jgi:hypothetical protein
VGCNPAGHVTSGTSVTVSEQRPLAGFCEHGNEYAASIQVEGFLE